MYAVVTFIAMAREQGRLPKLAPLADDPDA